MGNCFKGVYGVQKHKRIITNHQEQKLFKTTREQSYLEVQNDSEFQPSQHPKFNYQNLKKQKINLKVQCPSVSQHSELLSRMRKNQQLPKSVFDDISIRDSIFAQSNNQSPESSSKIVSQSQVRGKSDQTSQNKKRRQQSNRNLSDVHKQRQYQLNTIF